MPRTMTRRVLIKSGVASAAALPLAGTASAQAWPSKPIQIVCGYPAGGLTDLFSRAYGDYISAAGRPAGGGREQAGRRRQYRRAGRQGRTGRRLHADVHDLHDDDHEPRALQEPALRRRQGLRADLQHVGRASAVRRQPRPRAPTNLKEFVEYARKNKVSIGTYAAGSYAHIAVAELNKHFGLQMEAVHYRGEAPMWQDLAAGVIQAASGSYAAASNVLQSGAGRAIAVPQEQAHAQAARRRDLPRAGRDGQGLPAQGLHLRWSGPPGMPQEIVQRLSDLMVEGGKSERVQQAARHLRRRRVRRRAPGVPQAVRRGGPDLDRPGPGPRPDAGVKCGSFSPCRRMRHAGERLKPCPAPPRPAGAIWRWPAATSTPAATSGAGQQAGADRPVDEHA